jgi:hypothetical protein
MIPKVIHYCWFGGNPLPQKALKCISSWKKYCPDYQIKQWDESNFDVNACAYTKEAYKSKKYAFVSDYARFKILYENGGLYFDTDVEVIKSMDDIIERGPFMGCEPTAESRLVVNAGLGLAADVGLVLVENAGQPEAELYKRIIDYYKRQHFISSDGDINTETVVTRVTRLLTKEGFKGNETIEHISGIYIYPTEYFCPVDNITGQINVTNNTHSIHHYDGSWLDERQKKKNAFYQKLIRKYGPSIGGKLYIIYNIISDPKWALKRLKRRIKSKR